MRRLWFAAAVALWPCVAVSAPVKVEGGLLEGVAAEGLVVYKGIPFAAPPVGELRWRPPQPAVPWVGVRAADRFAPDCVPSMGNPPPGGASEDCLYLNVWTPAKNPSDRLPVLVWIYGGGFNAGSTSVPVHDGARLARRGVVLVSIAYRVGVLGFFAHPELSAESPHHVSGNYGLLDMVAGLQWIERNVAAFGGDPRRVTIFGESAGGIAVSMLSASPLARGLFHGAISQSGGSFGPVSKSPSPGENMRSLADAEVSGAEMAQAAGAASLKELRALPPEKMVEAGRGQRGMAWPITDGWVIPDDQYRLYEAGRFNDTPILVGYNSDEGLSFTRVRTSEEYVAGVRARYGPFADRLLEAYPAAGGGVPKTARDLARDSAFGWHTWSWARLQSSRGRGKAFLYYFDQHPERTPGSPEADHGAPHGVDVPFVFGTLDAAGKPITPDDQRISDAMATYWTNFAKRGDPNGDGLPAWPPFDDRQPVVMHFSRTPKTGPVPSESSLRVLDGYFAWRRSPEAAAAAFPVTIRVDAGQPLGELAPVWRFFGGDEPNYATMKDGRKLLAALGELKPGSVYFRTHNLLNTGDGTPALKWGSTNAYTEDAQGRPVYDWTVVDRIFDTYLERGVRPYVQVGFMPKALSRKPEPYQHEWRPGLPYDDIYTGWAHPPRDYAKWEELVFQWVRHCLERYGREEVSTWYWETWNEANIGYWKGTFEEFLELHDRAVAGVRRALPEARVGGPDMAGSDPKFLRPFLEHVLGKGLPLDFVAFHAKGSPTYVDGHVRMGIAAQLATIDQGFRTIASFAQLKRTPIVIGESDPEGCAACQGSPLAYRNGTMYSSYTAAVFARKHDLARRHGVNLEGALTWAFEFEDQPYFAGFRALATNGIPLPVLNVFRMFSKMRGQRVPARSSAEVPLDTVLADGVRGAPDVAAFASVEPNRLAVMAWHYHDDDVAGPEAAVDLSVAGLPATARQATVTHYRIDEKRSNAYAAWKRMGSPIAPTRPQYDELEAASRLAVLEETRSASVTDGTVALAFGLPRQAVSLVTIEWD